MAATVIIPCRNEQATIGPIVSTFYNHPVTKDRVFVGIDADTTDDTPHEVILAGGYPIRTGKRGKGQVVFDTLRAIARVDTLTERVILCDGDYTGLTADHIERILRGNGMTIGMPDWPDQELPLHVIDSWARVSGFRCLPWNLIPADAHGYLLETQLNVLALRRGIRISIVVQPGLKSPFRWPLPAKRYGEMIRDRKWGQENGILG